jgi:hypothetical protein
VTIYEARYTYLIYLFALAVTAFRTFRNLSYYLEYKQPKLDTTVERLTRYENSSIEMQRQIEELVIGSILLYQMEHYSFTVERQMVTVRTLTVSSESLREM